MGIFKFLKSKVDKEKKAKQVDGTSSHESNAKSGYESEFAKSDFLTYIKSNHDLYQENDKQIKEAKTEYQMITSYLTDMQKIDMIPQEHRETLDDAASNVYKLNKQRLEHQNREITITDLQYELFESYELQLPKDLTTLKEEEAYKKDIQRDIEHLDKERLKLNTQEEEIISKQGYLRGIGFAIFIIIIILFALFLLISYKVEVDLTLPFLLTVLMGMFSTLYIFMESRKNTHDMKLVGNKINRQIHLMNKVKIKAVNNHNYLQYIYNKYMVTDHEHLKELWDEYVLLKEETLKYKSNTDQLEHYSNQLVNELERFGIRDKERWTIQSIGIIDSREMVELRHRLNNRRRKLREQIEASQKQQEEAIDTITRIIEANPDKKEEASKLLKSYNILEEK